MGATSVPPSSYNAPYSGANPMPTSFNIVGVFKHAIDLTRWPAQVMSAYRDNDSTLNSLIVNYVGILAGVALVATLIGNLWYYGVFGYLGFGGGIIYGYDFVTAILGFIGNIVSVVLLGFIVWKLGPSFGTSTTQIRATRLVAYAYTPYLLLSVLNIIPFIGALSFLGLLYGLYILYLGMPLMLGTPQDKSLGYVIVSVIAVVVVAAVVYSIVFGLAALAFFHIFAF
jgi:Yip1 domain